MLGQKQWRWLLWGVLLAISQPSALSAKPALVFAAASLQGALDNVADAYAAQGHERPVMSYAGSALLARQIIAGAPADIYISADMQWMQVLIASGQVDARASHLLLGNRLVLVAPRSGVQNFSLQRGASLARALGGGRLAMGDPDIVPAGSYARAALQYYDMWPDVAPKLVRTDNVRQALMLAERGEVAMAIVYASDAQLSTGVRVLSVFPAESHPAILYPAARLKAARGSDVARFYRFLFSPTAQQIFKRQGFLTAGGAR